MEETNEKVEVKSAVEKAGLGKRTIAGVIDCFIMLFLTILIFNFAAVPLFNLSGNVQQTQTDLKELMVNSHLYIWDEDSKAFTMVGEDKYIESSKFYFEDFCHKDENANACPTLQGEKTLANAVYNYKNTSDEYVFRKFYNESFEYIGPAEDKAEVEKQVYYLAANYFRYSKGYQEVNKKYNAYFNAEAYISLFIASALTYLLIPMLTKDGKTFGKLMFGLSLTNSRGYKIRKSQILVRFLVFFVTNVLLGVVTIFILPFISFTIMIFSKKHSTIHDYFSATMVIEDRFSTIYNNEEEQQASLLRQEAAHNEIIENRKKLSQTEN